MRNEGNELLGGSGSTADSTPTATRQTPLLKRQGTRWGEIDIGRGHHTHFKGRRWVAGAGLSANRSPPSFSLFPRIQISASPPSTFFFSLCLGCPRHDPPHRGLLQRLNKSTHCCCAKSRPLLLLGGSHLRPARRRLKPKKGSTIASWTHPYTSKARKRGSTASSRISRRGCLSLSICSRRGQLEIHPLLLPPPAAAAVRGI